jgi:ArsR family transcriptional regulator
MAGKRLTELETLFRALADRTRLRMLGLLGHGEICVCEIHETLRIPQPKASRHLAYLRAAGLVETRRKGLWIYYRLAEPADRVLAVVQQAARHALQHVDDVGRDMTRLHKKTGCCSPSTVEKATFVCCEPAAESAAAAQQRRAECR